MIKSLLFVGVALAALVAGGIPVAQADPATRVTLQDNFILTDVCIGENVQFIGTTEASAAVSIQNGIAHLSGHLTERDDGTGLTSGADYQLHADATVESNMKLVNNTGEANIVADANVIGQGAVANESVKETAHVTVNANGTITIARTDISMSCH
jgi:hypothetical protein